MLPNKELVVTIKCRNYARSMSRRPDQIIWIKYFEKKIFLLDTFVLLICLFIFYLHLKRYRVAIPASNDEKHSRLSPNGQIINAVRSPWRSFFSASICSQSKSYQRQSPPFRTTGKLTLVTAVKIREYNTNILITIIWCAVGNYPNARLAKILFIFSTFWTVFFCPITNVLKW